MKSCDSQAPEGVGRLEDQEHGGGPAATHAAGQIAYAYWSPAELLEVIAPLLVEGLGAGDKVVHVADDLAPAAVAAALRARGVAVEAEAAAGRLEITTAAALLFPGGALDPEQSFARLARLGDAARAAGLAGVRLSMEMTWLLAAVPGVERALELEARLAGPELGGAPLLRLCAFNAAREVTDRVADALRAHPALITHGIPVANPYYRPWSELRAAHEVTLPARARGRRYGSAA